MKTASNNKASEYFQEWYISYLPDFKKVGREFGMSEADVSDGINQFFLDLLEKDIDPLLIKKPKAYLCSAFRRKLIDHYRKSKSIKLTTLTVDEGYTVSVQDSIEQKEVTVAYVNAIHQVFQTLPERCKKVLYLKFYKNLSSEEIARFTGLSKRSVYNNLFEGIRLLRLGLKDSHPGISANLLPVFIVFLSMQHTFLSFYPAGR